MRRFWSGFVCLALSASVLSGLSLWAPAWAHTLGLDVWEVPSLLSDLDRETQLQEQMSQVSEQAIPRLTSKFAVAEEVDAGRMTVPEAALRFRELDATATPTYLHAWRNATPGADDDERYRITVLRFVEQVRAGPPGRTD
jgi:hypothetical protein